MKLESKKRDFDVRLTQGFKIEANSTHGLWHVENPESPSMFYELGFCGDEACGLVKVQDHALLITKTAECIFAYSK